MRSIGEPRQGKVLPTMRLAFLVLLCCFGLLTVPADGFASGLVESIKRIKPSIVAIGTYDKLRRPPGRFRGTGFAVVDGQHVLTNQHVLPSKTDLARTEELVVFRPAQGDAEIIPVRVVAEDRAHDIAILRLIGKTLPPLAIAPPERANEGQSIAFTGFPIGAVLGLHPVTHRGIISAITPIAIPSPTTRSLDAKTVRRLRDRFSVFQLDATAYPGNSGSPVYDAESGEVLAIVGSVFVKESKERLLQDPSGITYAIPMEHAVRLLRENGVLR